MRLLLIEARDLLRLLRRAAQGEDPDLLVLEVEANLEDDEDPQAPPREHSEDPPLDLG